MARTSVISCPIVLFIIFCFTLVISPTKCCFAENKMEDSITSLFIFGDSMFDVGNNNYFDTVGRANFYPYGETYFHYPTGRFSDGRVFPDFIAIEAKLPLIPPYLQPGFYDYTYGINFASGGAGALTETNQGLVIDLKTQVGYFKKASELLRQNLGKTKANSQLSRAVYLISIGHNDYSYIFRANSTTHRDFSSEQFAKLVIGNITEVIQKIHKIGGRKFVFLNLGPLGCTPTSRIVETGDCSEKFAPYIEQHNEQLLELLTNLVQKLDRFKFSIVDFNSVLTDAITRPSKYGFEDVKTACCGSGPFRGTWSCGIMSPNGVREYELCDNVSEYLFFDFTHVGERFNELFAKKAWSGTISTPYTLKALFESS